MPFDGIVTANIAKSLNEKLSAGKIEKIYQPDSEEILMQIHANKQNYRLLLSANSSNPRIHLITSKDSNPQNPMSFCMLLRKHFQSGRIVSISQKDSERIIEIYVDTLSEMGFSVSKKLTIEIMGKHSNIIAIDVEKDKIIDSIKRVSIDVSRFRQILPGQKYVYPPSQDKLSFYHVEKTIFMERMSPYSENSETIAKGLVSNFQGISPVIASQISESAEGSLEATYQEFSKLIQKVETSVFSPCVYMDNSGSPKDFYSFPVVTRQAVNEEVIFEDINEAAEYYYEHKDLASLKKQKAHDLTRSIKNSLDKIYLKKQRLLEDIAEAEKADKYKLYGELLTANMYNFKQGDPSVSMLNYYTNETVNIPLDVRLSPSKNAQRYFKKYSKSKTAIIEKGLQLEEATKDITYLESILLFVENAESNEDIEEIRNELIDQRYMKKRKNNYQSAKKKADKFLSFKTSEGLRVSVGKNNLENDVLTFKKASAKDIWLHTKDIHGSHVILFTDGKEASEKSLFEAAAIAAYYSKGRLSNNVPVDYTFAKYVKKPSGAKPGFVIFTHNKTLYVKPELITQSESV